MSNPDPETDTAQKQIFQTPEGREIWKEPIVAYAIVGSEMTVGDEDQLNPETKTYVAHFPLTAEITLPGGGVGDGHMVDIPGDFEILSIVPAQAGHYEVKAVVDEEEGWIDRIGYEYAGASNPDWDSIIDQKRSGE